MIKVDSFMPSFLGDGKYLDPCELCEKALNKGEVLKDIFKVDNLVGIRTKSLIRVHNECYRKSHVSRKRNKHA